MEEERRGVKNDVENQPQLQLLDEEELWNRETVPRVMELVCVRLRQRDVVSLLLVSPWLCRALTSCASILLALEFRETQNAGDRLLMALSLPRYHQVKQINMEFARSVDDNHMELLRDKRRDALLNLEILNLNGCQTISDRGIGAITMACPKLKIFSIYWNVRVTDVGIKQLVKNCKHVVELNLSGCKNISDKSLQLIAENYQELVQLNLTRCIKLTDCGMKQIVSKCSSLKSLNLYALSSFTDESYMKMSLFNQLTFLDLCGAQNLSDQALSELAKCKNLVSLNLTWCVRVTDAGVMAIAHGCTSLEFLSLFGIVGVTDRCLETLARFCSKTLSTLDVNGCIGIKRRTKEELLRLFPTLSCFKVHS